MANKASNWHVGALSTRSKLVIEKFANELKICSIANSETEKLKETKITFYLLWSSDEFSIISLKF